MLQHLSVRRECAPRNIVGLALLSCGLTLVGCSADGGGDSGPRVDGDAIGVAGAHEHGVVRMGLAVDGARLTLDLQAPADALFGFEHQPESEEERRIVAEALDRLRAEAGTAISLPAELACTAETVEIVEAPGVGHDEGDEDHAGDADHDEDDHDHDEDDHDEDDHDHDEDDHDHDEDDHDEDDHDHADDEVEHSEVRLAVSWTCAESPERSAASLRVDQLIPDAELVDLTVITSMGQAAARVAPGASFRF